MEKTLGQGILDGKRRLWPRKKLLCSNRESCDCAPSHRRTFGSHGEIDSTGWRIAMRDRLYIHAGSASGDSRMVQAGYAKLVYVELHKGRGVYSQGTISFVSA